MFWKLCQTQAVVVCGRSTTTLVLPKRSLPTQGEPPRLVSKDCDEPLLWGVRAASPPAAPAGSRVFSSLRRPCAVLIASASPPDGNAVIKPDTTLNCRAPGWAVGGTGGLGGRDAALGEPQSPCWC